MLGSIPGGTFMDQQSWVSLCWANDLGEPQAASKSNIAKQLNNCIALRCFVCLGLIWGHPPAFHVISVTNHRSFEIKFEIKLQIRIIVGTFIRD